MSAVNTKKVIEGYFEFTDKTLSTDLLQTQLNG